MGKTDIEKRLKRAVEQAVPDVKERILERCASADEPHTPIIFINRRTKKREKIYSFVAIAAVFVMCAQFLLNMHASQMQNRVVTVVDLDVNPSIELRLNEQDRIVEVCAINEDAERILDGMDLRGTQTRVAVNAILGSMLEHGYLIQNTDSILVSVDNRNEERSQQIKETLVQDIDVLLQTYSVEATVLSQTISTDAELQDYAQGYGISQGKALLIQRILECTDVYVEEELVHFTISELNEIICSLEDENNELLASLQGNSVSSNNVSENSVSENGVSENEIGTESGDTSTGSDSNVSENTISGNSVSGNQVSENEIPADSVSNNSISQNQVSENELSDEPSTLSGNRTTVSGNQVSGNSVSGNQVNKRENNGTVSQEEENKSDNGNSVSANAVNE